MHNWFVAKTVAPRHADFCLSILFLNLFFYYTFNFSINSNNYKVMNIIKPREKVARNIMFHLATMAVRHSKPFFKDYEIADVNIVRGSTLCSIQ